ncbi:hypothetical protein [Nocardia altamirensis]|uniref:hypothetical protein n=1 Tax=Nocardia altamirensis TaxID=472158 RepID=UPI00114CA263|nr:hypothetical protein [Nocardia altamirensis]
MDLAFCNVSLDSAHLHRMHEFLTDRGWVIIHPDYNTLDDNGMPTKPSTSWRYPDSFGGVALNSIEGGPYPLVCRFGIEWLDHPQYRLGLNVDGAGYMRGCPDHTETEHHLVIGNDAGELDLTEVGVLLDRLEPAARALNARDLIECRYFGPCGRDL